MSYEAGYFSRLSDSFGRAWNRFWFEPAEALPLGVLRIGVGAIVVLHLILISSDLGQWYSRSGLVTPEVVRVLLIAEGSEPGYHASYYGYLGDDWQLKAAHGLAIVAAVAFTAGLAARVAGAVTLAALLALVHRLPLLASPGEHVLTFLVFYLVISPCGATLSLDSWIRRRRQPALALDSPATSLWANLGIRLIQVHLAAFIAMMGLAKLYGDAWWDGIAMWSLLAQTLSRPMDLTFLRRAEYLINFWTHAVLGYHLAFPVLIWNSLARPLLLWAGVVIWGSLILATGLGIFGLAMMVANLAFVPAESYRRIAGARLARSSRATERSAAG